MVVMGMRLSGDVHIVLVSHDLELALQYHLRVSKRVSR